MHDALAALRGWAASAPDNEFWIAFAVLAVLLALGTWQGFARPRRARLIEDTPTQRVRSAAQGYVELEGRARWMPGPGIFSPLSRSPCVWWTYKIQQQRGSGRNRRWHTLESGTSDDLFLLDDGTGECVIDADGALVYADVKRQWRGATRRPMRIPKPDSGWLGRIGFSFGSYRYVERCISAEAPLHAMGRFDTARAARADDEASEVRALLGEWKRDRASLIERFDADGDGTIDLDEWERARSAALETVRQRQAEAPVPDDVHVMRRSGDGRPFVLSTWPQDKLARYKRITGFALLAAASGAAVLLAALLEARLLPT